MFRVNYGREHGINKKHIVVYNKDSWQLLADGYINIGLIFWNKDKILITTVSTIAAMGLTAAISVAAVATLIGLLTTRELASASYATPPQRIARFLNIGIIPLVMVFAVIVVMKVIEVLA